MTSTISGLQYDKPKAKNVYMLNRVENIVTNIAQFELFSPFATSLLKVICCRGAMKGLCVIKGKLNAEWRCLLSSFHIIRKYILS